MTPEEVCEKNITFPKHVKPEKKIVSGMVSRGKWAFEIHMYQKKMCIFFVSVTLMLNGT